MISPALVPPKFQPGQLVRHKRYGYRGVVVEFDASCQASEAWYEANQTQPERNQPWYHVLVHEATTVTYAAQSSLVEDPGDGPVLHPLISEFFSEFTGKAYVRNNRPWPEG